MGTSSPPVTHLPLPIYLCQCMRTCIHIPITANLMEQIHWWHFCDIAPWPHCPQVVYWPHIPSTTHYKNHKWNIITSDSLSRPYMSKEVNYTLDCIPNQLTDMHIWTTIQNTHQVWRNLYPTHNFLRLKKIPYESSYSLGSQIHMYFHFPKMQYPHELL